MALPACLASLATRSGQLHIFTEKALEIVIDRIPLDHTDGKLEGYDIFQWAAFAKKKSSIASSICRELGSLKASRSAFAHEQDGNLDPLCRSDPWAGASFKLSDSASKQPGDDAAFHEHHMEKAPLWQKYFSRPSEQHVQGAQDLLGHSFEQPPLWQEIPAKQSELKAMDGSVDQVDGNGHQLADKWRKVSSKALVQQRHASAMEPKAAAVCAEGHQPKDDPGAWVRTTWPSSVELSADDVMEHFEAYGEITDLEWLEDASDKSVETIKLHFRFRSSLQQVLARQQHSVRREADGKLFTVKTHVKFTDNAPGGQVKKK
jgi:hypothetical protein